MKRTYHRHATLLCVIGAVLLVLALAGCGSNPTAPAPVANKTSAPTSTVGGTNRVSEATNEVQGPRSYFHTGAQAGRDPFYPGSSRNAANQESAPPTITAPLVSYLKLLGIRFGTTRPMALINRTTFAPGEEASVAITLSNQGNRSDVQRVNVRCLEIRRDSVLVSIAGVEGVKELRLAQAK